MSRDDNHQPGVGERFADVVDTMEGQRAQRPRIFDPESVVFRASTVGAIVVLLLGGLGGVWGIAVAFAAFKTGQENTRDDVDKLRDEMIALRKKVLYIKEGDLWADSMRVQNAGKVVVPKPSDFKIEQ